MKLKSYVTTCARNNPTLDDSVASIRNAGFEPCISSEDDWHPGTVLSHHRLNTGTRGSWTHFLDCCEDAVKDAEWDILAIFQDDILICKDLWSYLAERLPASFGVASLWLPAVHSVMLSDEVDILHLGDDDTDETLYWWYLPYDYLPHKCYGALAVLMPRDAVEDLLSKPKYRNGQSKTDLWLGRFCKDTGRNWWYPSVSFVQHIGHTSTLGPETNVVDPKYRYASRWISAITEEGFEVCSEAASPHLPCTGSSSPDSPSA